MLYLLSLCYPSVLDQIINDSLNNIMTMKYVIISDPTGIFSASITVTATVGNIG